MDNFYKNIYPEDIDPNDYDFDHPRSLDFDYYYKCLNELINKGSTDIPTYSFITNKRLKETEHVKCSKILICEGILILHDKRIRNLFDLKLFIQCDTDIALGRRIIRDIKERGRDVRSVLHRYNKFVKKDFEKYIQP